MQELLNEVSMMIDNATNIPDDIKPIVKAVCRGYVRESKGLIPLEGIKNVCDSEFVLVSPDDKEFMGENVILGSTETDYDEECNVIHRMSYVNYENIAKLVIILTHELGHVMTEFSPNVFDGKYYIVVKRTMSIYARCFYEDGEFLANNSFGYRMSDGFLEHICTLIFESEEFKKELLQSDIDISDYEYKDKRLFDSRIYDEFKACFELFDYLMDGYLFELSCKKYSDDTELRNELNKKLYFNLMIVVDAANNALWELKKFEGKERTEEFDEILNRYKKAKVDVLLIADLLAESFKKKDDERYHELLEKYNKAIELQHLLPLTSEDFDVGGVVNTI